MEPADFSDPELATAIGAAVDVHAEVETTGSRVDPVTVAWAQQRHTAGHGAAAPPHRLHTLTAAAESADLDTDTAANVQVTGTVTTTCNAGQPATPTEPTAATLVVVRQHDGTWHVDQRIY